ncbi:MAG: methyltransferase, FxLD system, partial [Pseudonocardiaceae bacterium]
MSTLRETTASKTDQITHADALRETMIGELREMGAIRSDRVAEVFRAVPRHLFTPGAPLEEVYTPTAAVHVKWDEHGVPIST